MKNLMKKILLFVATGLLFAGCDSESENKRTFKAGQHEANTDDATTEIISSESVKDSAYLSKSEEAVKRYRSIDNIAKILSRTLGVGIAEREWSTQVKKNTGMLSYLGTSAVNTTSRSVDSVSLAWFKEVRNYTGLKCGAFVNREASNVKEDNLLIKSKNAPTEASLNSLTLKALRLDGVDDSIHEITKHYSEMMKNLSDEQTEAPGTDAYVNGMKNAYRLYCIAVLTDPMVIFY